MAQSQPRQLQPAVSLGKVHACFVEFDTHLGDVATGGNIGIDHRHHIAVEVLQQVVVLLCQLLLVLERNILPVGSVDSNQESVVDLVAQRLLHVATILSRAVECRQSASKVERLRHCDTACHYVVHVDIHGVGHLLTHIVEIFFEAHAAQILHDILCQSGAGDTYRSQEVAKAVLNVVFDGGADVVDVVRLLVAEEVDVLLVPHIGAEGIHFGEKLAESHAQQGIGGIDAFLCRLERGIALRGKVVALRQGELLRRRRQRQKQ